MAAPKLSLFVIDTYDTTSLGIADTSSYPSGYTVNGATLEVKPPDMPKVAIPITAGTSVILRATDLGLSCDEDCLPLPDGIYEATYSIYPNTTKNVTKRFLRIELLKVKFQEAFLSLDDCDCSSFSKDLMYCEQLIYGCLAAHANCDLRLALKLYNKASLLLDTINCED